MVSNQKIRFFRERLESIEHQKLEQIASKHPEIKTDYKDLIASGMGKMKSENEIRKIIGNVSRYSCPPVVEVLDLFVFDHERDVEKKREQVRRDLVENEKAAIRTKVKKAMDLVYFGKDEEMKAALDELEAI